MDNNEIKYDGVIHKWNVYRDNNENYFRIIGMIGSFQVTTSRVEKIIDNVAYTKSGHKYLLKESINSYASASSKLINGRKNAKEM